MSTLARLALPRAGERWRLALSVLLAAGATGAAIALLASSGYLISRAAQRPQIIALTVAIVGVRAFGISRAALRYAERLASHDLALRSLARLRLRFFTRLAPLVPGELRGHRRGELLARFVSDVDTLMDLQLRVVIPSLVAVMVIVGASVAGALMLPAAGLVLVVVLTLAAFGSSWVSATVTRTSSERQAPARARLTAQLVESIDGSAELAIAGHAPARVADLRRTDETLQRLVRRDAYAGALAGGLHTLLTGIGLLAVLVVGVAGVRSGAMPGVLLAAIAFLFLGACEAVAPIPVAARRWQACRTAAARLDEVCERDATIVDPVSPVPAPESGPLALEDVTLRYEVSSDVVLREASLHVAPGERVALVGASGAGKTTIAELLVRFLDPAAGRVSLGGVDVRDVSQEELRRAVLLCGQDAHLFNTTIRENLLIAGRATDEQRIWEALRIVELDAFVAALPDGLDTIVGQQGELVSGGQRRRLALARALLSKARFLILDEPLAHLDAPLARRVLSGVLQAAGRRGLLVITHATELLDGFDRVVTLDAGRCRDTDITQEVMTR